MIKSYSQQAVGLKPSTFANSSQQKGLIMDKYQSWRFFPQESIAVDSQGLKQKSKAKLSTLQQSNEKKRAKQQQRKTTSFVDKILEAAQEQQDRENREIFLTQVHSESILPPIKLCDTQEYKKLLSQSKHIPYLISKHVRLASDRHKLGSSAVDNTHYRHYEKQDLMEVLHSKVKPSEKTLNYVVKFKDHKPSLELMKTVNKGVELELQKNDKIAHEIAEETYQIFGMNSEDREDVGAILQEEGDKVQAEPQEIKFTEHQTEFRNICSKVNKEKSAEIFLRFNEKYSQWNLKDKHAKIYFLSRAASKEPRDFIEKEIQIKKQQQQYDNFNSHSEKIPMENKASPRSAIDEAEQSEDLYSDNQHPFSKKHTSNDFKRTSLEADHARCSNPEIVHCRTDLSRGRRG